jgi:hypothetical protein
MLFSFFTGSFRRQFNSSTFINSPKELVEEKLSEMELLFMKISKINTIARMKRIIIKRAMISVSLSFKYYFKSVKKDQFY